MPQVYCAVRQLWTKEFTLSDLTLAQPRKFNDFRTVDNKIIFQFIFAEAQLFVFAFGVADTQQLQFAMQGRTLHTYKSGGAGNIP